MMNKIFFLLLTGTVLLLGACASTQGTQGKTKEERMAESIQKQDTMYELLESRSWVLEATMLHSRQGLSYPLNPSINFVGVDSVVGTVQLAFDGVVGWNGVGGVTLDGQVVDFKLSKGKPGKGLSLRMRFFGTGIGNSDLFLNINNEGYATCEVSGNWGERISFSGQIVPLAISRVYKGTPRY